MAFRGPDLLSQYSGFVSLTSHPSIVTFPGHKKNVMSMAATGELTPSCFLIELQRSSAAIMSTSVAETGMDRAPGAKTVRCQADSEASLFFVSCSVIKQGIRTLLGLNFGFKERPSLEYVDTQALLWMGLVLARRRLAAQRTILCMKAAEFKYMQPGSSHPLNRESNDVMAPLQAGSTSTTLPPRHSIDPPSQAEP
ncbi:hypothetical protein FRB99_003110 [Tulasnella sp. 403]|nr:hypothetical protein FRB99_003110 [Tulasnella sp. 403]